MTHRCARLVTLALLALLLLSTRAASIVIQAA